jgi:hypothetical protein
MKKGTILFVFMISLISIVVVAFFGVIPSNIEPVVYISEIDIKDSSGDDISYNNSLQKKSLVLDFEAQTTDENGDQLMGYYFTRVILPENATKLDSVAFSLTENSLITLVSPKSGGIAIKKKKNTTAKVIGFTLYCTAFDGGPGVKDSVYVVIKY